jgi:putative addiction module killer protein
MYPNEYICLMVLIKKTDEFDQWFRKLKDRKAKAKILVRIQRMEEDGNFGDCQPVGEGISELRINYAAGYRVYVKELGEYLILLLIGGDKSTQRKDIQKAKLLRAEYQKRKK